MQHDRVGGEGAGLVQAQHVHAGERLHRVGLLHQRAVAGDTHRAQPVGHGDGHQQAVGDQPHDHHRDLHALHQREIVDRGEGRQHHIQEQGHQQDRADQQVEVPLQRRGHPAEGPRALGDLPGQGLPADLVGLVAGAAGDAEAAGVDRVAGALGDVVRLAGEQRLVARHVAFADHHAVDHQLVAGPGLQHVALHDVLGADGPRGAVADHRGLGAGQQGDAVQGALGAHLLHQADQHIDQHHAHRDQRVGVPSQGDQRNAQHVEDVVDEGEDVVADDPGIGAAGAPRNRVALAAGAPGGGLLLREADGGCGSGGGGGCRHGGNPLGASAVSDESDRPSDPVWDRRGWGRPRFGDRSRLDRCLCAGCTPNS